MWRLKTLGAGFLTGERVVRRLAAILAADVAGYSRLMGRDENGTLTRLKAHRTERLEPTLARHGGRLVKLTGDGALVEFPSAVDALGAAIEFQQAMAEANRDQLEDTAIVFRIGLHLGDLIVDGDDLYGDGVNVAARLEAEAPAGGIVISRNVHDAAAGRLKATFDDLGGLALKNIERPVQAFGVKWEPADWKVTTQTATAPSIAPAPAADAPLALPDKPSIAVLPFQNMSGDPEQEYFADGMVEEIITALSRVKWFFVIARNSSFTYKGKHVDIRQVGRELGVRYVLEGSIRKSGNRVRITGQLIEAATGNHVWADKFEGDLNDVFELQDRITEAVVAAIEPSLELAEIRRSSFKSTNSLDAYDLYLRALPLYYSQTREDVEEALRLLDKAIVLDPNYAFAKAFAAQIICLRITQWWATSEDIAKGSRLAHEALLSSRDEPTTIAFAAHALAWLTRDYDTALAAMDRAVRLNPNSAQILARSGWLRIWLSDADRAIDEFSRSIRLSPVDPWLGSPLNGLAHAFLLKNEPEKALDYARRSTHEMPRWVSAWMGLVVASVNVGNEQEAHEAARRMMALSPSFSIAKRWNLFRDKRTFDLISNGLRKAGVPE